MSSSCQPDINVDSNQESENASTSLSVISTIYKPNFLETTAQDGRSLLRRQTSTETAPLLGEVPEAQDASSKKEVPPQQMINLQIKDLDRYHYGSTPHIPSPHVPRLIKHTLSLIKHHSPSCHATVKTPHKGLKFKSKSMTNLRETKTDNSDHTSHEHSSQCHFKIPRLFHIPSFRVFSHEDSSKIVSQTTDFNLSDPMSTPLLIPNNQSLGPAIFLYQNTPDSSPRGTPCHDPDRKFEDAIDKKLQVASSSEESIDTGTQREDYSKFEEAETEEDSRGSLGCVEGLKKRVTRRPTLQIPNGSTAFEESAARRHSLLSFTAPGRRPSIGSLLSLTPSVSLGGRRFSFNLGSRVSSLLRHCLDSPHSFSVTHFGSMCHANGFEPALIFFI